MDRKYSQKSNWYTLLPVLDHDTIYWYIYLLPRQKMFLLVELIYIYVCVCVCLCVCVWFYYSFREVRPKQGDWGADVSEGRYLCVPEAKVQLNHIAAVPVSLALHCWVLTITKTREKDDDDFTEKKKVRHMIQEKTPLLL